MNHFLKRILIAVAIFSGLINYQEVSARSGHGGGHGGGGHGYRGGHGYGHGYGHHGWYGGGWGLGGYGYYGNPYGYGYYDSPYQYGYYNDPYRYGSYGDVGATAAGALVGTVIGASAANADANYELRKERKRRDREELIRKDERDRLELEYELRRQKTRASKELTD